MTLHHPYAGFNMVLKVNVVGVCNAGRTSLLRRFAFGDSEQFFPIGLDFFTRIITLRGATVKFQVWDQFEVERCWRLNNVYRGTSGVVLVYDISDRRSFDELRERAKEVAKYCHELDNESVRFVVLGNKCDLPASHRCVGEDEGRMFAQSIHAVGFFEVSAKDGTNVAAAFCALGEAMLDCRGVSARCGSVRLPEPGEAIPQRSRSRCCV